MAMGDSHARDHNLMGVAGDASCAVGKLPLFAKKPKKHAPRPVAVQGIFNYFKMPLRPFLTTT
jgi:hypothetical protein